MKGLSGSLCGFFFFIISVASTSYAQSSQEDCISGNDLREITQSFPQFSEFSTNQETYCEADLGKEWFQIGKTLTLLKSLEPNEPDLDSEDAFTFKAIQEKNWWSYFVARANHFVLPATCQEGVVAFVRPFFGSGTIHLCPFFFEFNRSSQASTLMHEVRHFDGFAHVTCSQGSEEGTRGACDQDIRDGGSYAISLQTLVGMARAPKTDEQEKVLLESEAIYMAFNKYNQVPQVKLEHSIYLADDQGAVFQWVPGQEVQPVAQLDEPALILNSANNLTLYPLDAEKEAYRKDRKLIEFMDNPGLFARAYNEESPEERALYRSISYFGLGGLLKDNQLLTLCNRQTFELGAMDLNEWGEFDRIVSLSEDENDQQRESFLLSKTGELFEFTCASPDSSDVLIGKTEMSIKLRQGVGVMESFGLNGDQFALLSNGELAQLSLDRGKFSIEPLSMPLASQNWVSATPLSTAEVF